MCNYRCNGGGVRQGYIFSTTFFNIFLNGIVSNARRNHKPSVKADNMPENTENADNTRNENRQEQQQSQTTVLTFMLSNKVEAGLWLTRMFTVVCTVLFFFPFMGNTYSFYQRALISNAATSALRLHQRLPNFQLSREFLGILLMEDSCHYLLFSIIFMNSYPISMTVVPVFLFGLLHACSYTKNILNVMGPNSLQFVRNLIAKLEAQQINILRFVACTEIFLMPAIIFMLFTGKSSIILPFVYYRFLTLRYASRRNPYCRNLFGELRLALEQVCAKPQCPQFVRSLLSKSMALVARLAPAVPAQ
ncbi:hypothetical protein ScPMuIL_009826 [Solemya velum]